MPTAQTPHDLASRLHHHLTQKGKDAPPIEHLTCLVEAAFFASMQTEESQPIRCTLAFLDPSAPDPQRPQRVRPHRCTVVALAEPVPLSIGSLAKLAQAAPADTSAIAVFIGTSGEPIIWGLIDQELHNARARDYEQNRTLARPGRFQIELSAMAEISVYDDLQLLATLRKNEILSDAFVVLREGPVKDKLVAYVAKHEANLQQRGTEQIPYGKTIHDSWMSTLSRLLNRIRRYRHGAAVLLLPDSAPDSALSELKCKYRIDYGRLAESVSMSARSQYLHWCAEEDIEDLYQSHDDNSGPLQIPFRVHNSEHVCASEKDDWRLAQEGCISFVAGLSRIDGLILMRGLHVTAFGVEILTKEEPEAVVIAGDELATERLRRRISMEHYGTRHRSMLRFCHAHPEAVGFVISHEGDIRAVTRIGTQVVLWESIHLYTTSINPRISGGGVPKGERPPQIRP